MLRPEQVKPLLLHEDRDVRGNASQYFADCGSLDPEVAELILQAILKCDCNKLYGQIPVHNLRKVVAGASTAPLLLKAFEKYDHPSILRD